MKPKKLDTEQDSKVSHVEENANELDKLVKKTMAQDKVLKKLIEEIKTSTKDANASTKDSQNRS